MKVICYGDSNTFGYDPRSYFGGRYPSNCRWVDILAANTGWDVINLGENGRGIPGAAASFPRDTDLLIIMLGTNDLLQGDTLKQITDRMDTFLGGLTVSMERILLVAPPPMQLGEWVTDQNLLANSIRLAHQYETLAKQIGVRFADAGNWNIAMTFDGVHFTEEGHKVFAEGLLDYLNEGE